MSESPLDDLDFRIIELLGRDARVSNRQIASDLGVTEGTIRTRIKSLQDQHLIQFTVVTDFRLAGSPNLVMMGIHADPGRVPMLAEELSRMPEIGAVVVLLGRYNLLATGLFTSLMDVNRLIRTRILSLRGVRSVETSVSVQNFKYNFGMARITSGTRARSRSKGEAAARTKATPARKRRGER
jgi:Lrp/AsnC family transcriptional regulator for asnA, asnC and gidA